MKKIIKKLIIISIITCMLIIQTIGECKAEGENIEIETVTAMSFPFHYEDEINQTYRILQCGDKIVYSLNRKSSVNGNSYSEIEPYGNDEIIRIIEAGYPNKEPEKLGLANSNHAYVATQEAIYANLENKDLSLYKAELPVGTNIINAMNKIVLGTDEKDIMLKEENTGWIDDTVDNNYCYKDYKITMKSKVIENSIALSEGENCKITNEQGVPITTISNNQIIRLTVPKGMEQTVRIRINYKIETPKVYKTVDDRGMQYLIIDFYNQNRQYEYKVNTKRSVLLSIINYNKETNLPIKGNKFQVLNENKDVYIRSLETNEDGLIGIYIPIGNYYIKQIETVEGNLQKEILNVNITGDEENIQLNVFNTMLKQEESVEKENEVNLEEETTKITENKIKDITNIHTSNIEKEIIKQTNETNMNNINYFINTINRKNIANLTKENTYENEIFEDAISYDKVLPGERSKTNTSKQAYKKYIDSVKSKVILPVALKQ